MFGYIVAPVGTLSKEDEARYKAAYCGLCRSLGERYGQPARLALTYDLTFLTILLQSLYEPEERKGNAACLPHPIRHRDWERSEITDYAADLTIALTWYKCMDDWQDDHALHAKAYAGMLQKDFQRAAALWPRQCKAIEEGMKSYTELEHSGAEGGMLCACFGQLMSELFVYREDEWSSALRTMGRALGQFICLMDAAVDYEKDKRRGKPNLLPSMNLTPEAAKTDLMILMGRVTDLFEKLPLVQDLPLLRSILYAGVWQQYNAAMEKNGNKKSPAAADKGDHA